MRGCGGYFGPSAHRPCGEAGRPVSNRRKLRGADWEPLSRQIRTITTGRETQLRAEINSTAPGFLDQVAAATTDAVGHYLQFGRDLKNHAPDRAGEVDARNLPDQVLDQ